MNKTLKFAAAAVAMVAATAAFASSDDGKQDNAWIAKDVATIHMEPQVIIAASDLGYTPYSMTMTSAPVPAPSAVAYTTSNESAPSADSVVLLEQTTVTYYTVQPAPATSPMVDNAAAVSPNP